LAAIAGGDSRDPTSEPVAVPDYTGALTAGISNLAIGVDWDRITEDCEEAVAVGLHHVAEVLASLGARIRPMALPKLDLKKMTPFLVAGMSDAHRQTYPARKEEYGPAARALLDAGLATTGIDVAAGTNLANAFRAQLRAVFNDVDLILAPSLPGVAP